MYTIPVAKIAGKQGRVYALDKDKEALDALMQKTRSAGLFYFPQAKDRRRLLGEIYRIMKPSAFLSMSVWPNLVETDTKDEIENANFRLEKEVCETPTDNKGLETCVALVFRKA